MKKNIEKIFYQYDIDNVSKYIILAKKIVDRHHEFSEQWVEKVTEELKPYAFENNAVQMYVESLQKLYKKQTGKDYPYY